LALIEIGPAAVPALIGALKDENEKVRRSAAGTLGIIGLEAKTAVPFLIEALKDKNEEVRQESAGALENINTPEAQKALKDYARKSK